MTKIQELAERAKALFHAMASPNASRSKSNTLIGIIDELADIAESKLVVNTIADIPADRDEDGYSDNRLIDLNGHRIEFAIGYYDHKNSRWIICDDDKRSLFEPEHMTYQRLPLAKYDNEK